MKAVKSETRARLLHVMGHDHDGVVGLQLVDQFLDLGGSEIGSSAEQGSSNRMTSGFTRDGAARCIAAAAVRPDRLSPLR